MSLRKYIRGKLILFLILTGCSFCFFKIIGHTEARDNAYLASFIDEDSCMYKFQVIYSGVDVELERISAFFDDSLLLTSNVQDEYSYQKGRLSIKGIGYNTEKTKKESSIDNAVPVGNGVAKIGEYNVYVTLDTKLKSDTIGQFSMKIEDTDLNTPADGNKRNYDPKAFDYGSLDSNYESTKAKPLTFPFDADYDATTADINRAYYVMDEICTDFTEALLFINGGKSYTNVSTLIESAYYLVTAGSNKAGGNAVIENKDVGTSYEIKYDTNSCNVQITDLSNSSKDRTRTFTWRVKKGYCGYKKGDILDNGETNKLTISDKANTNDTEYITWEHLFLEAGMLYEQGISYSNAADIFKTDSLESSFVSFTRNVLGQLRGLLQLYEMEDCVFNSGVRGSRAFVYGAYQNSWTSGVSSMFMIFVVVALSILTISVINLFVKKQFSTISATARFSLLEGIRDLIISLIGICFVWVIFKYILLLLNYQFVDIWRVLIGNKKLADTGGGYATFGAVLYQFVYFFIAIYVNGVYILRQFFLPALMIISPLCIALFSFGYKGKLICGNWLKQLLGVIFIQSFHALVYGFIVTNSVGLRGIESLISCASFIPLTTIFANIFGISPSDMLKQATSLTNTARAGVSGAFAAGTGVVTGSLSGAANIIDKTSAAKSSAVGGGSISGGSSFNPVSSTLRAFSGGAKTVGGLGSAAIGAGYDMATQDKTGSIDVQYGLSNVGSGVAESLTGAAAFGTSAVGAATWRRSSNRTASSSNVVNRRTNSSSTNSSSTESSSMESSIAGMSGNSPIRSTNLPNGSPSGFDSTSGNFGTEKENEKHTNSSGSVFNLANLQRQRVREDYFGDSLKDYSNFNTNAGNQFTSFTLSEPTAVPNLDSGSKEAEQIAHTKDLFSRATSLESYRRNNDTAHRDEVLQGLARDYGLSDVRLTRAKNVQQKDGSFVSTRYLNAVTLDLSNK